MKHNGLDVYDIIIGEGDIGIGATSLVTLPATESSFLHFGKDLPQFKFADEEKQELIGAIMIPEKLIFRQIGDKKFYVNFTKEVIRELTTKMLKDGTVGLFTIQHGGTIIDGDVEVQEVWVKETDEDKSSAFGIEEPIGTTFMKVNVKNPVIWNAVKDNGLNGFSIELDASIVKKSELFNKVEEPKNEKEMKINDFFKSSIEANETSMFFNGELKVGTLIFTENKEGLPEAYSGDFAFKSVNYSVVDGVVKEAENIEVTVKEAIQALSERFDAQEAAALAVTAKQKEIDEKEAELDILKTQFLADKETFEKAKVKKKEVKLNLATQLSQAGGTSSWLAQFKKV